jgi:hypothetical protein
VVGECAAVVTLGFVGIAAVDDGMIEIMLGRVRAAAAVIGCANFVSSARPDCNRPWRDLPSEVRGVIRDLPLSL